jgi:hypothetical protein
VSPTKTSVSSSGSKLKPPLPTFTVCTIGPLDELELLSVAAGAEVTVPVAVSLAAGSV